jgi:ribose 1,5-bisphosphokinase PhnN
VAAVRLIYVVGPPGSGKSTLMAGLTAGLIRVPTTDARLPRDELYSNGLRVGVELGRQRGDFSGTDALAMNIHPLACAWVAATTVPLIFGEGQRLGTRGFLSAAAGAGRLVDLIHLDPPAEVCAARRAARGSRQQETWVRGATTRATRLASEAPSVPGVRVIRVTDHGSAADTSTRLRKELHLDQENHDYAAR